MGYYSDLSLEEEDNPFEEMEEASEVQAAPPVPALANATARQTATQSPDPDKLVYFTAPDLSSALTMATSGAPVPPAVSQSAVPVVSASAETPPDSGDKQAEVNSKPAEDEESKKRAHEEAEAKRKTEWEAKQAAKKAAEAEKLARVAAMSDQDVMTAAMQQLGEDAEKLTRRNMKECVTEYIQTMCLDDPAFARKVMHPKKSFVHCIWHINNKAAEFAQEEMKANGFKPERGGFPGSGVNGMYGCDVPDDMVYQWAAEYFNDPNAKEDEDKEDKFVPQPYRGTVTTTKSKAKDKKKEQKKAETKKPEPKPVPKPADSGQMDFFAEAS